jgi:type I site-specific restriction endonuclease
MDESNVIYSYTREQAIEDGVLILSGTVGATSVVFTSNLFADGYEDKEKRIALVNRGLEMLRQPDPEDSDYMKLRVIEKDKIWVIWHAGEGFTFMKPEDY